MTQPSTLRRRLVATGLAILSTLALHACGGGGSSSAPAPAPAPAAGTRALAADFYTRKAVAYSGYRGADRNTVPTSAEVLEDLQLLM
jgi:hypothetical protein